jgi:hypothetical protein
MWERHDEQRTEKAAMTKEERDSVIEECAKMADAEGLSEKATAGYCAAAFHIAMCIRTLKAAPVGAASKSHEGGSKDT